MPQNHISFLHPLFGESEDLKREILGLYPDVLNFIERFIQHHDAQDITQETIFKALRSQDKFDPKKASLRVWIYKIAHNKLVDLNRKIKRKKEISLSVIAERSERGYEDEELLSRYMENISEDSGGYSPLLKAIEELPPYYRDTIIRYYFLEQTYDKIEKECNSYIGTVKSRLYSAKRALELKLAS